MSAKAVREYHGKRLLARHVREQSSGRHVMDDRMVLISPSTMIETDLTSRANCDALTASHPWLLDTPLVVKPDQLIKRRGKAGLVGLGLDWDGTRRWIADRESKEIRIGSASGPLTHFLVEPYVPHDVERDEYYVCIQSDRDGEEILFHSRGGVDVGDVDSKARRLRIDLDLDLDLDNGIGHDNGIGNDNGTSKGGAGAVAGGGDDASAGAVGGGGGGGGDVVVDAAFILRGGLLDGNDDDGDGGVPSDRREKVASFVATLYRVYRLLHFTYMEINPIVYTDDDRIVPLDLAAKLDETASFLCSDRWGHVDFPAPFGRVEFPEEAYIRELDSKTGASLKLTILNPGGRIWTMVAGGGASVVYADTISDLGHGHELANYGEYSGAPSTDHTFEYAKTLIRLMTRHRDPRGKVFIIGGGIANFTDVAATFTGLIKAIKSFQDDLKTHDVRIWVRRAGPNYQEGLQMMREAADATQLPIRIYGPETHITAVVPLALGLADLDDYPEFDDDVHHSSRRRIGGGGGGGGSSRRKGGGGGDHRSPSSGGGGDDDKAGKGGDGDDMEDEDAEMGPSFHGQVADHEADHAIENFTAMTRCVVYGLQNRAVQGMLDFDYMCKREAPSVAAMIFPFASNHYIKFYWGTDEKLLPVYQSMEEAFKKHPEVTVVVNFASFRSVHASVTEMLRFSNQIRTIAIIAEGVPESQTRSLNRIAQQRGVGIIGPATVGGIKPGCFRIGNTGGMLDNIVMSKLYRPGSVAYVSKSGGMSNELNNIISRNSDGVYEGVAIGGDRYPGSRFIDHLLRYNDNPDVHLLVLLGEVGGVDEYEICDALRSGRIVKPMVAWCIGTCASIFPFEVQFGHAGALARGQLETARAKNRAMKDAGAHVPDHFGDFGKIIREVYDGLVGSGTLVPAPEPEPPKVPMDYTWAKRLGLVRKPANFISSISDDRGEELTYSGKPISEVFEDDIGVGGVLSLLWFRRQLPPYATKFIDMILMVTADHGPAVSGAHNTIVAARAGKDLVSSLASGLLTIGPRFGGALDDAARMFAEASDDAAVDPDQFVRDMRKSNRLIMGIGHRIKSLSNPDRRVEIIKNYALEHFSDHTVLNFALAVEQITTRKKANLILNVDGCIAASFVDMMRSCGAFSKEEADELVSNGCLNGLFVLGRSIGFIGHYLDQKRLKQGLYRHPWDDISYLNEN